MRYLLLALPLLILQAPLARAQVAISGSVQLPGVSIGINIPAYPEMLPVPGYPVYYGPRVMANLFFYDGQYWVYQGDSWYASGWYNGPWQLIAPYDVPAFVLRVPVRYYRVPPVYFRGWNANAAPRWGQHWGPQWRQGRAGWDHWDRRQMPRVAPLPAYQRGYAADRYPGNAQDQRAIQSRHEHRDDGEQSVDRHDERRGSRPGDQRVERRRDGDRERDHR